MKPFLRLKSVRQLSAWLAAGLCSTASLAANLSGSEALIQFTPHDRLYQVAFDGAFGEAVGNDGLVLVTTDSGKTWQYETHPPTDLALISVAIAGGRSIAVGQDGLILVRDGRKPWKKIDPPTQERLLHVSLGKNGLAIAVGAFGTVVKSTDNGDTWSVLKADWATLYKTNQDEGFLTTVRDEPTFYVAQVFDDGSILIGGEYGQLNRSTDGGQTWTPVLQAVSAEKGSVQPTLFGMHIGADGQGYAAGQDGLIVATRDGGKTWTQLARATKAALFDIDTTSDGHVIAIGMRTALISSDAGKTWSPLRGLDLDLNWYCGLGRGDGTASNALIAVGHGGRVVELAAGNN